MAFELRVLGPLEVRRDGVVLPLGGTNVRALLAALAVDVGRVVSADVLIDALWPERPPGDARHALEATVSRLRRALGDADAVRAQTPGYVLDIDPEAVDAVRFRRLLAEAGELLGVDARRAATRIEDALALWRGPPYADVAFEAFARDEIARLEELHLQAEEQRIEAALADGRGGELVAEIAALVAAEPARERRREQLMLALYRAGRQADALATFRETRESLKQELGLEPSERLRELERAILRHDPAIAAGTPTQSARPRTRRPATAVVVEPTIPLELDAEEHDRLTELAAAVVARVAEDYGGRLAGRFALVFTGEDHGTAAAAAASELAVAVPARTGTASGDALVGDDGVGGPLLEIARRNVGSAPTPAPTIARRDDGPFVDRFEELEVLRTSRATLVVGPPGIGKSRLLRELAREARVVAGSCSTYAQEALAPLHEIAAALDSRAALTAAPASDVPLVFRRLCEAAAPVTIAFDDLQWAYPIVVETIEHIAEHADERVRIIGIAREELLEERPTVAPHARRLVLEPLPPEDAVALARALGTDDVSVVDRAEGNPLFIEQLLAHAGETSGSLPSTLHSLLASRLDRLVPTERAAIDCAAVAGRDFDARLVGELLQTAGAHEALASLVRRGLVEVAPAGTHFEERFRFRHALIHEAAYASIPKSDRARLHEAVADVLAERRDGDEVIGFHLEQAALLRPQPDRHGRRLADEAGERLSVAGIEAWKRGDAGTAVRLLERAIALLPKTHTARDELLCELGTALNTLGRATDADAAFAGAADSGDGRIRARARLERAALAAVSGSTTADEVLALADDAIRVAEAADDARSLGRALMLAGWIRGGSHAQHAEWQERAERALTHYQRAGWRASTCVGHIAAALYLGPEPVPAAIDRCVSLLREAVDDTVAEAAVTAHLGGLYGMAGDLASARASLHTGRALYVELGRRPSLRSTCSPIEAAVARLAGELEEAVRVLEGSCTELIDMGDTFHVVTQAAELADVLIDLQRLDAGETWCNVAEQHVQARDVDGTIRVLRARARLTRDIELAYRAIRLADETDALNLRAAVRVALAGVLALHGARNEAEEALATARDLYRRKGNAAAVAGLSGRSAAAS